MYEIIFKVNNIAAHTLTLPQDFFLSVPLTNSGGPTAGEFDFAELGPCQAGCVPDAQILQLQHLWLQPSFQRPRGQ